MSELCNNLSLRLLCGCIGNIKKMLITLCSLYLWDTDVHCVYKMRGAHEFDLCSVPSMYYDSSGLIYASHVIFATV